MDNEQKESFILLGMKDSTTATQMKLLGKKTPAEITERTEQVHLIWSPTEFKREAVTLVAVIRANVVLFEKITPMNDVPSQRNNFVRANNQSAQLFERSNNPYNSVNNRNNDQHLLDRVEIPTRENQKIGNAGNFAQNQMRQGQ